MILVKGKMDSLRPRVVEAWIGKKDGKMVP